METSIRATVLSEFSPVGLKHLESMGDGDEQLYGQVQLENDPQLGIDAELFVGYRRVICSVGRSVNRTYSFTADPLDRVHFATWARFKRYSGSDGGDRALCIVLTESIRIYFDSSHEHIVSLPCRVTGCWALSPQGLLLALDGDTCSRLVELSDVYGQLNPVDLQRASKVSEYSQLMSSPGPFSMSCDAPVSHCHVLRVLPGSDNQRSIVLALDTSLQRLNAYQLQVFGAETSSSLLFSHPMSQINADVDAVIYHDYGMIEVVVCLVGSTLITFKNNGEGFERWFSEPAMAISAVSVTRPNHRDLLTLHDEKTLSLRIHDQILVTIDLMHIFESQVLRNSSLGDLRITRSTNKKLHVVGLGHPVHNRVNIVFAHERSVRVMLDWDIKSDLARCCFDALVSRAPYDEYNRIMHDFLQVRYDDGLSDEWERFLFVVCRLCSAKVTLKSVDSSCSMAIILNRASSLLSLSTSKTKECLWHQFPSYLIAALQSLYLDFEQLEFRRRDRDRLASLMVIMLSINQDPKLCHFAFAYPSISLAINYKPNFEQPAMMSCSLTEATEALIRDSHAHPDGIFGKLLSLIRESDLEISTLPLCIRILALEAVRHYCHHPDYTKDSDFQRLVGRVDILGIINGGDSNLKSAVSRDQIPTLLFGEDDRLKEVARIFATDRTVMVKSKLNEASNDAARNECLANISARVCGTIFGQAMFYLNSSKASLVDRALEIEILVQGKYVGSKAPFTSEKLPHLEFWPEFHAGVSGALRYVVDSDNIDDSWIVFNRPAEPNSRHAGFLFGLGLTGNLKQLKTVHEFEYFNIKHDFTSCAMLMGLAVSNVGSESSRINKLLSLHIPALLPPNSIDLNISTVVQVSAMVGLGFLHLSCAHRRFTSTMLAEIGRREFIGSEMNDVNRDMYCLSAGFSVGLMNLGCGFPNNGDENLSILAAYINGGQVHNHNSTEAVVKSNISSKRFLDTSSFNTDLTAPGAIMALALTYLKSNESRIARVISLPNSIALLEAFTPERIMLIVIGRSLIMWNLIQPTEEWVLSNIPSCLSQHDIVQSPISINIAAGSCFVLALKHAGSGSMEIYRTISSFFNRIFKTATKADGFLLKDKVNKSSARDAVPSLIISLGVVMAGTGNLEVLKQLRRLHANISSDYNYGFHVAVHMAIGFLFLGAGLYSLGVSNKAIASLLLSCYPRFPSDTGDNRSHFQLFRHLWMLAVESRCLVIQDVDTGDIVQTYALVHMHGSERKVIKTPFLLPNLEHVQTISVESAEYWPLEINRNRPMMNEYLQSGLPLLVKKRDDDKELVVDIELMISSLASLGNTMDRDRYIRILRAFYELTDGLDTAFDSRRLERTLVQVVQQLKHDERCTRHWPNELLEECNEDKDLFRMILLQRYPNINACDIITN